jgi:hypothetical protein
VIEDSDFVAVYSPGRDREKEESKSNHVSFHDKGGIVAIDLASGGF